MRLFLDTSVLLMGSTFYGLAVWTPGMFLRGEREVGRLGEKK